MFDSAARESISPRKSSDADFLVEILAICRQSYAKGFFGLQADLSQILGRTVDLAETSALRNPYVQANVNRSREVVYAA